MLIVDVFVANLWMPFLLFGAGIREKIDGWLNADASAVNELQEKVEQLQAKSARIPSFPDWMVIVAIAFGGVAVSHLVADNASVALSSWLDNTLAANPDSPAIYLSSITKGFFGWWSPQRRGHCLELHARQILRRRRSEQNGICLPLHPRRHHWHEDGHWESH